MRDRRLVWNTLLLCLPAVALVAGGVCFICDKVPEFVKNEKSRIRDDYRAHAELIRDGEVEKGRLIASYAPKTLSRSVYKMKPGRWGFDVGEKTSVVWYDDRSEIRAVEVPKIEPFDFAFFFYVGGGLFMALFVAMTAFGIRYFWKFARERDDFLAATAHDLTTPLVGLRYAIGRNDEDARCLNERMIRLVENIKDFLRLGRRPKPAKEPFGVLAAYKEAYALFAADYRDLFDGADVETVFDAPPEELIALGDETLTVQIVWNLLGNDLKYAAPYGPVKVRFSREGAFVGLHFIDEGQGMTPGQMRKAFDRYYRARTVLESGKGGFGIGLCTAREFALSMGGDLTVRANEPSGCVFTLRLPMPLPAVRQDRVSAKVAFGGGNLV